MTDLSSPTSDATRAARGVGGRILASPLARAAAKAAGLDLASIVGSGPGGRIIVADVQEHLATPSQAVPQSASDPSSLPAAQKAPPPAGAVPDATYSTIGIEADMGAVNDERNRLRQLGRPVPGYTAWVVAATSRALLDHPYANAQLVESTWRTPADINIAVSVPLDQGDLSPVAHHADRFDVHELHARIAEQAAQARAGEMSDEALMGATFAVAALGMFGVDMFTPVVRSPNSASLGVGRLRSSIHWVDGVPSPATVMTLSISWDNRAFGGTQAARFARAVVDLLAEPTDLCQ